ncbi:MAG: hypothetical protein ACREDJ_03850, partial [Methylocella sp.]
DSAKTESFTKTLKAKAVYLRDYATFEDAAPPFSRVLDEVCNHRSRHSAPGYLGAARRAAGQHCGKGRTAPLCCAGRGTGAFYQGILLLR